MRPTILRLGAVALATAVAAGPLPAQREQPRERAPRTVEELRTSPLVRLLGAEDLAPDRAVIGVTLGEAGSRGIRVEEVAPDGPAAQAGIRAGDHLAAVGDVSLRLDPADADDPVLRTTAERRLRRALSRLEAGGELTLRVASGDAERTVRLRTVRADRLEPARESAEGRAQERARGALGATSRDDGRAVLGVTVGSTGTARDTLGAFVLSVVPGSPAERAGIYEGARIAAVNGVELRVPRADVEDATIAGARAGRLEEELRRVTAGDEVTLRVYEDGRFRDVRVRTARSSEVYQDGLRVLPGGTMRLGPGGTTIYRVPPGGGSRTFVLPEGGGRVEILTPDERTEGARSRLRADSAGPRWRIETAPRVRVWQDGNEVRVDGERWEALDPAVRERVEQRVEEAMRRLERTAPALRLAPRRTRVI